MESLPPEIFGEIVSYTHGEDLVSLCLSLMKNPQHPCNDMEFWRKMIYKDFNVRSSYKDPRQEYIDRRQYVYEMRGKEVLPFLIAHSGEIWAHTRVYDLYSDLTDDRYDRYRIDQLDRLGILNKYDRYEQEYFVFTIPRKDKQQSESASWILNTPSVRRELAKKYDLKALGY